MTEPDRPPMDGNRSDDIGMMSTPIFFEHGDEDGGTPAMGMNLSVIKLPWELLFEEPYARYCSSTTRDHVYQDIQEFLENVYTAKPGYFIEWDVHDIEYRDGEPEVIINVEFGALDGYRGDESLEDWVDRVRANTPFTRVYNNYVLLWNGRDELAETLSNTQQVQIAATGADTQPEEQ